MDLSVEIQPSRPLPRGQAQYVFIRLAHSILMCCSGRRSRFPIRHRSRSGRFPDNCNWRTTIAWWKSARVRKDVNVIGTSAQHPNTRYRSPGEERHPNGNPLMAQYLLAMLSQRAGREGLADPFSGFSFLGGPEDGRMGDYVFNQEGM
jgi:hypothetical protein